MNLNKGEWSEVYVFLKLLAEGIVYAADKNLEKIPNKYYHVLKIIKKDIKRRFERKNKKNQVYILNNKGQVLETINIEEIYKHSKILLNNITSNKGNFNIRETMEFMHNLGITKLKAKNLNKEDISIEFYDRIINSAIQLNFSIKSHLGAAPTLFNPSKSSNFIFKVEGLLDKELIKEINSISSKSKIIDRINKLKENNCQLIFMKPESQLFKLNLQMIDSQMPQIISSILLIYYQDRVSKLSEILKKLEKENLCNYNLNLGHSFYRKKVKELICSMALGMTSNTLFSDNHIITGGCIVVKENGDVVCYHIYNRNEFEDYLLENTKLDTPSSSRFNFGIIESDSTGDNLLKLNLQIRFINAYKTFDNFIK